MDESDRKRIKSKRAAETKQQEQNKRDLANRAKSLPLSHSGVIGGGVVGRLMGTLTKVETS